MSSVRGHEKSSLMMKLFPEKTQSQRDASPSGSTNEEEPIKMAIHKFLPAAIAASVALAVGGCSSDTTEGSSAAEKVTIGMSITNLDEWLSLLADAVKAEAVKQGVTVQVVSAEADPDTQVSQVENFIARGVDAIIVNPVDTEAAEPITDAAQSAGIPLVYVNRCPEGLPAGVSCVGSDSKEAGTLEMDALGKLTGYKGTVGILEGDPNNNGQAVRERTAGCRAVIDQHPDMKLVLNANGKWGRDAAMSVTENWIQSGQLPDMICANNDEMALGAINALKAANKLDRVKVGGIDATKDALVAMAAGDLAATVFQDAKGQGSGALDAAVKLVGKQTVEAYVNIPFQLVTKENMSQFTS